jgi:hypothetical protein
MQQIESSSIGRAASTGDFFQIFALAQGRDFEPSGDHTGSEVANNPDGWRKFSFRLLNARNSYRQEGTSGREDHVTVSFSRQ